ncbi:unnamed protein product [Brassicogethes aeneus]|uniref:Uncharacterized protein n=1 Tax=Brassicogethes aeneus TaxID=1431903 RepID=A0A9P0FEA4_BRAAE|nr:unnamed protein product [Brassicogethes aeneus]
MVIIIEFNKDLSQPGSSGVGRLNKHFLDCAERSKRHKVKLLRESFESDLLSAAAKFPENFEKKMYMPTEQALALITHVQLSKHQYEALEMLLTILDMIFYHLIIRSVHVDLQSLVDHTPKRILEAIDNDVEDNTELLLVSKWGCDGNSGQSEYNKKYVQGNNQETSESSIYMVSMVPLKNGEPQKICRKLRNPKKKNSTGI